MRNILAAIVVVLAGCAAPGPVTGPKGWVAYSLVQEVAFAPAYLSIRPVGTQGEARSIGIFLTDAFSMQKLDGSWGVAKAVALRPGTYEIYNFFLERGGTRTQYRSRQDFSLRFEVKDNEVAYLGEFKATMTTRKSLVDWLQGPSPYFILSDRRDRDIAAAVKATPEVQAVASRTVVLTPVKPTPLIRGSRAE